MTLTYGGRTCELWLPGNDDPSELLNYTKITYQASLCSQGLGRDPTLAPMGHGKRQIPFPAFAVNASMRSSPDRSAFRARHAVSKKKLPVSPIFLVTVPAWSPAWCPS